jgi:hypothetical protein
MSSLKSSPIPELERALSPYINTNQDTANIRKALSRYLSSNIKSDKSTLHHLDHACPKDNATVNTKISALKGARLRYLHTLEAKLKAQARHYQLQKSLEELQTQHSLDTPLQAEVACDQEATKGYISLLRQRRRVSELQVIQNSVERLLSVSPAHDHKDPKSLVKEIVGEQPDIPAERLEQLSEKNEDDTSMFKLKKEVLEAKAGMDRAKAAKADARAKSTQNPSLQQQVYALGCARDELVAWVETELSKIGEESVLIEDASPVKRLPQEPGPLDLAQSKERIYESYNQYIRSRADLIDAHTSMDASVPASGAVTSSDSYTQDAIEAAKATRATRTIADVLPHLPSLALIGRSERALLQQTVYMQTQLSSAEEGLKEALLRLSEESHLLPSGPPVPVAWAKSAAETEIATKAFDLCSLQSNIVAST